ncbi:MAG: RNA polymerase sigma-70 factor [Prolixibacteraceae bacterium]|jgi:RNA polymerase sigma-70 factor (ECF subfamily)|nr:RNA polymerase sigma-70 factor [Prolixibacteraceae bacterium]
MDEKYLIAGLRNKDKIVFDFIFTYYYSGLCTYSLKFIQEKDTVEDIVQDFFVSLWLKSSQLVISGSVRSYLFTSVRNRCLDYLKHSRVKEKYGREALRSGTLPDENNFDLYVETELREAISAGLEKLPPRCREIFEMSRFKGMKNQEIAEKLNISKRTVELQISLSLKTLRFELKDFLPVWMLIWLLR